MQCSRLHPLLLTVVSLPLLAGCHISDRGVDFSPVTARFEPEQDDDVILDGYSAGPAVPVSIPQPVANAPQESAAQPPASLAAEKKPAAPAQQTSQPAGGTYTVVAGDTLSGLARRNGTTPAALAAANNLPVTAGLKIGQKLRLPASAAAAHTAAARHTATAQKAATAAGTYKVQPGDTLYRIARRHNISPAALMQANKLTPQTAGALKSGTSLTIPATR